MEGYDYDFMCPSFELTQEVKDELEYMPALPSHKELDPKDDIPY